MLIFQSRSDTHSTYLDADGCEVFLGHGFPRRVLIEFDVDAVMSAWADHQCNNYTSRSYRHEWLAAYGETLIDPDDINEMVWCSDCSDLECQENGSTTKYGDWVCEPCVDSNYTWCQECEELVSNDDTTSTLHDTTICDRCRSNWWSFCEDCDGYYRDGDSDEHQHNGDGCCESPVPSFIVRNDGDPALANDVRATITLPAGTIDEQGISRIQSYLMGRGMYAQANLVPAVGPLWQAKDGNFTKRLSRMVYKTLASKMDAESMSNIGNIAREHSNTVAFDIEFTRDLNLSAEEFGHEDSCWWGSYSSSRCALKSNGGFAMRVMGSYGSCQGRAWIMPLRLDGDDLVPTFDTMTADAFVVFNGYGDLSGYNGTRILSHMVGMTYRKIQFSCNPMYVNGGSGYLVAPEEIASRYTDGQLSLYVDQHSNLYDTEQATLANQKELVNV